MVFKDEVLLPPHSFFLILSHHIAPDRTSNGSVSTGRWGTSNRNLKQCLVTLSIKKNGNNLIAVGKTVNALTKVIDDIEGDSNEVKLEQWKINRPNLYVLKYIKGGK